MAVSGYISEEEWNERSLAVFREWKLGHDDQTMASNLEMSTRTIERWRWRLGLTKNASDPHATT